MSKSHNIQCANSGPCGQAKRLPDLVNPGKGNDQNPLDETTVAFNVPGTQIAVTLSAYSIGKRFWQSDIKKAIGELEAVFVQAPSAMVLDPSIIRRSSGNIRVTVWRTRLIDEYPNLYYVDARKILIRLRTVLSTHRIDRQFTALLKWSNGQKVGEIKLDQRPSIDSAEFNSTYQAESLASAQVSKRKLYTLSNDFTFTVTGTKFSVSLFADEHTIPIGGHTVNQCMKALLAELSLKSNQDPIKRKVREGLWGVSIALEPLPRSIHSTSAYSLTFGDAEQIIDALGAYLNYMRLYVPLTFQIHRITEFIAVGSIRRDTTLNANGFSETPIKNVSYPGHVL